MTSQDNLANLKIWFVVPKNYTDEEECNEDMWEAYNVSSIIFFLNISL